jgi:hypothetical protein
MVVPLDSSLNGPYVSGQIAVDAAVAAARIGLALAVRAGCPFTMGLRWLLAIIAPRHSDCSKCGPAFHGWRPQPYQSHSQSRVVRTQRVCERAVCLRRREWAPHLHLDGAMAPSTVFFWGKQIIASGFQILTRSDAMNTMAAPATPAVIHGKQASSAA